MCFAKDGESPKSPVLVGVTARADIEESPRSSWRKLLRTKQVVKPKLTRKIASSARINLNKYWSKFGDLMAPQTLGYQSLNAVTKVSPAEEELLTLPFSQYFYPIDPVKPASQNPEELDHRFEAMDAEINDNMANEVREICYTTQTESCFLCKLCYD